MEEPRKFSSHGKKRKSSPLTHCENCGAQLRGHWCAQCGQPAIDYRRSLQHVLVDLLDEFLSWDSKFFKTITWLVVQPWKLTNEFLAGHRIRYVRPLRLYLLASILFFFAVNYWAKAIHIAPNRFSPKERAAVEAELKKQDMPPEVRAKIENALNRASLPASEQGQPSPAAPTPKEISTPLVDFSSATNPSTPFESWIANQSHPSSDSSAGSVKNS